MNSEHRTSVRGATAAYAAYRVGAPIRTWAGDVRLVRWRCASARVGW